MIPEGIAIYPEKNSIYISSIHKDKIVSYNLVTGNTKDLIKSGEYGFKHGVGMEVKGDLLFALSSETIDGRSSSQLLVYDLKKDEFVNSFQLKDSVSHFMNDLAISDNLEIYITDTERHLVYKFEYPYGTIVPYLEDNSIRYPNGIAISDTGQYLHIDSYTEGLRIVDLSSNKIVNPLYSGTSKYVAVDGLKFYKGSLYGIRNGDKKKEMHAFVKIMLNNDQNDIDGIKPLLTAHPRMDIPTTFCVNEGYAYILANSQLDKLDQNRNKLVDRDALSRTYVIKIKL